jgi:hypothetical protein
VSASKARGPRANGAKRANGTKQERALEDRVVALRSEGKSFASIATEVGIDRGIEVFAVFAAAVARRPPDEQERLRAEENVRLDTLERRVNRRPDELDRRRKLASIAKLRKRLAAP